MRRDTNTAKHKEGAASACPGGERASAHPWTASLLKYQFLYVHLAGRAGGDAWEPSYSWRGFRYVELALPDGAALLEPVVCYPMRTDVPTVAAFSSSEPVLAELRALARHTFESNMMSIQSDCPHRERFGYGGDALGAGEAGLSIFDFETFYAKRVADFNDADLRQVAIEDATVSTLTKLDSCVVKGTLSLPPKRKAPLPSK